MARDEPFASHGDSRVDDLARRLRPARGWTDIALRWPSADGRRGVDRRVWADGSVTLGPCSVVNIWCGVKPAAAMLMLSLLEERGIGVDDPIGDHFPGPLLGELGAASSAQVLANALDLHRVGLVEARLAELDDLDALVQRERAALLPLDGRRALSEFSLWWVVDNLIRSLCGRSPLDELASRLDADGLDMFFGDQPEHQLPYGRIACLLEASPSGDLPLLHDQLIRENRRWHLGFGGFASARGLADLYFGIGNRLDERTPLSSPSRLLPSGDLLRMLFDGGRADAMGPSIAGLARLDVEILGRSESCCPRLIGHFGWSGISVGLLDRSTGLGLGIVCTDLAESCERIKAAAEYVIDDFSIARSPS